MSAKWAIGWESEDPYICWGIEEGHYPKNRSGDVYGPFYFTENNHKMYPIEDEL